MKYSEFFIGNKKSKYSHEDILTSCGCDKCILPKEYEFGHFEGENGIKQCKFCAGYEKIRFLGEEKFIKDVNLSENEKIGITVSGGKDSIYMWYKTVELFGSDKVVALTYLKNGLVHPYAIDNINSAKNILQTEHFLLNDEIFYEHFKENLEAFLKKPKAEMVRVALCAGCRYGITGALYKEGRKRGISKYVSAASYLELAPFKEELLAKAGEGCQRKGLLRGLEENGLYETNGRRYVILREHDYKYKGGVSATNRGFKNYTIFDFDIYYENNPFFYKVLFSSNISRFLRFSYFNQRAQYLHTPNQHKTVSL
jgi:hypothetical protein